MKTMTIKMPEGLHREFKVEMILDGMTMQDRIIELIESEVDRLKSKRNSKDL
ncbi:hypothetical protein [Clostridium tarantellae]|uniref:hypothetical protein n=1 Tax=Clostridium tarantellae TaxID=39493 RepID=UPI001478854C|nr:hypothetical protein [Clostridium tarantellae]